MWAHSAVLAMRGSSPLAKPLNPSSLTSCAATLRKVGLSCPLTRSATCQPHVPCQQRHISLSPPHISRTLDIFRGQWRMLEDRYTYWSFIGTIGRLTRQWLEFGCEKQSSSCHLASHVQVDERLLLSHTPLYCQNLEKPDSTASFTLS